MGFDVLGTLFNFVSSNSINRWFNLLAKSIFWNYLPATFLTARQHTAVLSLVPCARGLGCRKDFGREFGWQRLTVWRCGDIRFYLMQRSIQTPEQTRVAVSFGNIHVAYWFWSGVTSRRNNCSRRIHFVTKWGIYSIGSAAKLLTKLIVNTWIY